MTLTFDTYLSLVDNMKFLFEQADVPGYVLVEERWAAWFSCEFYTVFLQVWDFEYVDLDLALLFKLGVLSIFSDAQIFLYIHGQRPRLVWKHELLTFLDDLHQSGNDSVGRKWWVVRVCWEFTLLEFFELEENDLQAFAYSDCIWFFT